MFIFSYALRSIGRNRGRYLLFAMALLALTAVCFVNLSLGGMADALCEAIKMEYGTEMRMVETNPGNACLTIQDYQTYAETELVRELEVRGVVRYISSPVCIADSNEYIPNTERWEIGINLDYPNQFTRKQNPAVLLEGRLFEAENECVITDSFFAYLRENGALNQVGDNITIQKVKSKDFTTKPPTIVYEYIDYVVVGIVDGETVDAKYREGMLGESRINVVYFPMETISVPFEEAERVNLLHSSPYIGENSLCNGYDIVFRLRSYEDIDAFTEFFNETNRAIANHTDFTDVMGTMTARSKLARGLVTQPVMPEFAQLLVPLEQLQTFSLLSTATIAVLALAVVLLMCIINMRERKYEIGVLRCVGMSRARINLALGVESAVFLFCTALVGVALGAGVLAFTSGTMIDLTLVESTIQTAAISSRVAVLLAAASLVLALFATSVSAAFVMRARPLVILRNRT